jgi:hypothetical protein
MVKTRRQLVAEVQVLLARTGATETRKNLRERVSRLAEERKQLEDRVKAAEIVSRKLLLECEALRAQLADAQQAAQSHGAGAGAVSGTGGPNG